MTFPPVLETLGNYWMKQRYEVVTCGKAKGFKLHATFLPLQVYSIFYLAMNMNGTLGSFFYHLFSVLYPFLFFAVHFVVTFERLAKTFKFLQMIHGSSGATNVFYKNLHKYKNSFDSLKDTKN